MKQTHPALWGAGWAGLAVGGLLTIIGVVDAAETARLAGGYGLLLMGSAGWLLGGLGLRRALARRSSALATPAHRGSAHASGSVR